MTIPENFSPTKHLQSVLISVYNKFVKDEFKDFDIDDLGLNITVPRQSLYKACKITSEDSQIIINNRMMLFYMVCRKAQDMQAPIYGIPVGQFLETRRFRPQVTLYFKEDAEDIDPDYRAITAEISFRLMNESETTISKAELTTLANKIKAEFGGLTPYRWKKGKTVCSYIDPENGYSMQIYAFSKTEGKEVIGKVLDLRNKTPQWEFLTVNENEEPSQAYPTIPPSKTILGKSTRLPRKRPVGYVRFLRATCQVWGVTKPIALYDRTGQLLETLADD
jgi:hypothetical protein